METLTQELTALVSEAFAACGYDKSLGIVTAADRPDLGQFQCNGAFGGAKLHKKAPAAIAADVIERLSANPLFAQVSFAPPGFINLTLSGKALTDRVNRIADGSAPLLPRTDTPEKIIIDYGGPNVAKPLHIGHLRSAIIGESLKRLARLMGHTVVSDVHLGDWGLQIGLVIAELEERHPQWPFFSEPYVPQEGAEYLDADALGEIYPFASARSKEDEAFREKARSTTALLQNGREGYLALWREIMRVSVADLKANYHKLGVDFDLWYGESNANPYVEPLLDALREKNLLRESEGALVVDVGQEGDKVELPPVLIKKSDNSDLYATTDLATIIQRQRDEAPRQIWYVVDARQELHFTQVFRCARRAGLVPEDTHLEFIGFGTMNGSDGKPYKTREGGVMRLQDLLETVTRSAGERLQDSSYILSLSEEEKREIGEKVGVAAVKFGDLVNYRQKDYVFNLEKFLSFEGKTGPYLLYMITRIHSILKRVGLGYDDRLPLAALYTPSETDLALKILLTGDVFRRAFEEKAPNYICENAYAIAALFSRFYHDNRIVDEPDAQKRQSWLALILLVRRVLLQHLSVLGIEPVENM